MNWRWGFDCGVGETGAPMPFAHGQTAHDAKAIAELHNTRLMTLHEEVQQLKAILEIAEKSLKEAGEIQHAAECNLVWNVTKHKGCSCAVGVVQEALLNIMIIKKRQNKEQKGEHDFEEPDLHATPDGRI